MFMNFGSEAQTKTHDTPNWVVKFEFSRKEMMIEDPSKVKQQSVLVMQGNVPKIYEYKPNKMVMIASQSLLLFDNWQCTREYKDRQALNIYYATKDDLSIPMGYI